MTAQELYEAGRLQEAVSAALQEVKRAPADPALRYALALLLCFQGDLAKADGQLEILSNQHPDFGTGIAVLRQLLRGERCRSEVRCQGRMPEFLTEPDETVNLHLKALIALREGDLSAAAALLSEAESQRASTPMVCDGKQYDDVRDLDDLSGSILEVLTSTGKYYWLPLHEVHSLQFSPPSSLADLLWRPVRLSTAGQIDGAAYVPALYVDSSQHVRDEIRLGRATEWVDEDDGPVRGLGLRMLLLGEEVRPLLEIERLERIQDDSPAS